MYFDTDNVSMYNELSSKAKESLNRIFGLFESNSVPEIKKVLFHNPATIVFWKDGTKTVVKADNEKFDPEKGLAMAISRKALGNKGNYYNVFKQWIPEERKDFDSNPIAVEYKVSEQDEGVAIVGKLTEIRNNIFRE